MALYEFQNPETKEVIGVFQKMTDEHVYVDEGGLKWVRVWNNPNTNLGVGVDPFSKEAFMDYTSKKGMTAGDMMDFSKELSTKREKKKGLDPIKNKTVTDYEKKTKKPHPLKNT